MCIRLVVLNLDVPLSIRVKITVFYGGLKFLKGYWVGQKEVYPTAPCEELRL